MKTLVKFLVAAALTLSAVNLNADQTEPKLVVGELPDYSVFARSHDVQGTVVVEALIDEEGRVFAADIVESVHKELDNAVLAAVTDWTFEPATEDGEPVMKVVRIPVNFNLVDPLKESLRSHDSALASKK
ncbi:MAG: energy transducer TonB [Puniceicoccaceae bacterium]